MQGLPIVNFKKAYNIIKKQVKCSSLQITTE